MIFVKKKPKTIASITHAWNAKIGTQIALRPFYSLERDGVSQSLLQEFLACRTKAHLSYREGWTSTLTSNPMTFGSLFHNCLEVVYRMFRLDIPLTEINIVNTIDNVLSRHKDDVQKERIWTVEDEENHVLNEGYLKILFPKYLEKYYKRDATYKWALVEDEFNNIIHGIRLRGKYDRVAVNKAGETWIFETKTKGRIDPDIQIRLSFDIQVMNYILNYEKQYGVRPAGFVYDIICRPALRKGKAETFQHFMRRVAGDMDESYFMRIQMRLDKNEFERWKDEFKNMLKEFKDWHEGRLPTYRNVASCENRYGNCKFIKICGLNDYQGLFKRKMSMPELAKV